MKLLNYKLGGGIATARGKLDNTILTNSLDLTKKEKKSERKIQILRTFSAQIEKRFYERSIQSLGAHIIRGNGEEKQ